MNLRRLFCSALIILSAVSGCAAKRPTVATPPSQAVRQQEQPNNNDDLLTPAEWARIHYPEYAGQRELPAHIHAALNDQYNAYVLQHRISLEEELLRTETELVLTPSSDVDQQQQPEGEFLTARQCVQKFHPEYAGQATRPRFLNRQLKNEYENYVATKKADAETDVLRAQAEQLRAQARALERPPPTDKPPQE